MKKIIAYKGFNEDWTCRGYQYEVGGAYTHAGEIELCRNGFHSCTYPLDVFSYYVPARSRYAIVEASVDATRQCDDSKIASSSLTVKQEVKLRQLAQYAVDWIMARIDESACEGDDQSAATNTGHRSAATNTGNRSAATNTGFWSAATNTGHRSAATNTGDRSAATNTGYLGSASVDGNGSIAIAAGMRGRARASIGSAIVLCYRGGNGELLHIRAAIAGRDVEPDTWYTLNELGEFVVTDDAEAESA